MATATKTRKGKLTPEERERDKRERFLRLAEARTNRAIKALGSVANLAGPGYTYSAVEGEAIASALIQAINATVRALRKEQPSKPTFSLPVE